MAKAPVKTKIPKTVPAFTIFKDVDGWKFVELSCDVEDGWRATEVKESKPDVRAVIQEAFKIAVGKYWLRLGS